MFRWRRHDVDKTTYGGANPTQRGLVDNTAVRYTIRVCIENGRKYEQ